MFQAFLILMPFLVAGLIGFVLIVLWYLKVQAKKKLAVQGLLELPKTKLTMIDGHRFAYWDTGSSAGQPVVLIHGIGASKFIWREIIPKLNENRCRTVALDLIGFGESDLSPHDSYDLDSQTENLRRFLNSIGIRKPVLVASSMGGSIALWYAKHYPDQIAGLILIAPAIESHRVPKSLSNTYKFLSPLNRTLNERTMKFFVQLVVARKDLATQAVIDHYLRPYRQNTLTWRAFGESLNLLADRRLPHELEGIKVPSTILFGAKDRLVRWSGMERLSAILGSSLVKHPTGGHHLMEDEPDWTCAQILDFIRALKHD